MKRLWNFLFSARFMAILFVLLGVVMAMATFLEKDYGAEAARVLVYNSHWFEILFLLTVVNLAGRIIKEKLYKTRLSVFIFHLAFILIIVGAGITRFTGIEGTLSIREGESRNFFESSENRLSIDIRSKEGKKLKSFSKTMELRAFPENRFYRKFSLDGMNYSIRLTDILHNAREYLIPSEAGKAMLSLLITDGNSFREQVILTEGEVLNISGKKIGFQSALNDSLFFNISCRDKSFFFIAKKMVRETSMMTETIVSHAEGDEVKMKARVIYQIGDWKIVAEEMMPKAVIRPVSAPPEVIMTGKTAMVFELQTAENKKELVLWHRDEKHAELTVLDENLDLIFKYGPGKLSLPFEIYLKDFVVDRYPGSSSPSSFTSEVEVIDAENNYFLPFKIYMNHVLKYRGYRFYQSSYDPDEQGSILSVNKDFWGMAVTYAGYFLLTVFIVLSLFNKNSLFRKANAGFWSRSIGLLTLVFLIQAFGNLTYGQAVELVPKEKAEEFGALLVQDQSGRTKPLYTLSNDILRKVHRELEFENYSAMQVFLGLYFDFNHWKDLPLIKVSNKYIRQLLGIQSDYAAFSDIVDLNEQSTYKLSTYVRKANEKPVSQRNKFDKEVIKVDERVNIVFMIYRGEFLKIFPSADENSQWFSPGETTDMHRNEKDSIFLADILPSYYRAVQEESKTGVYSESDEYLYLLQKYQEENSKYDLPARNKVKAEIFYYKSKIFERLFPIYAGLGLFILIFLMINTISGRKRYSILIHSISLMLFLGFLAHTIGIAVRWYISGHAPMSNGYESMIFISWVTMLAGFIFRKKSPIAHAATAIMAALTLMVAHLSFMDPQITALAPVLKSHWLTLHVSVITASYGFFGLGFILSVVVMILYLFTNKRNHQRLEDRIGELTVINYKSLSLGLYLLTIGTFLGAVWANESWGRYWGWDPKETWSLISILVYSFVVHSRSIPSLKNLYSFNLMAMFAFGTVLMTYFGVNYYISGLHSYAGGEAVPIPLMVYLAIFGFMALSAMAAFRIQRTSSKLKK